jgi:hypothetical protein
MVLRFRESPAESGITHQPPRRSGTTDLMDASHNKTLHRESSWGRKVLRYALLLCMMLALICVGILGYVRFWMDGDSLARVIIPRLERALDKRISYSSVHLSWLSVDTSRITVVNVAVRDSKPGPELIRVPKVAIEVSLRAIWRGVVSVNGIRLVKPAVALTNVAEKWGSRGLGGLSCIKFPFIRLRLKDFEVSEGSLVLRRSGGAATNRRALISHVQASLIQASEDRAGRFAARGTISAERQEGIMQVWGKVSSTPFSGGPWQGSLNLRLAGCPVRALEDLALPFCHSLPVADGIVDLASHATGTPTCFAAKGNLRIRHLRTEIVRGLRGKDTMIDSIQVRFGADRMNEGMQIDFAEVNLPGLSLSGEARLGKISTPDPVLTIALRNASIDLEKIAPFVPASTLEKKDREHLAEAALAGHVKITGAAWTGKLSDLARGFDLRGVLVLDAVLDQVSGFVPGLGLPISRASGGLRLSPDGLLFEGISLSLGSSPIVLNGWITGLREAPQADLFISIDAQAQDLIPIIQTKIIASRLEPWIGRISEFSGGVEVTLDLKGSLNHPTMKGRIKLRDFQCSVEGVPLPLKRVNGMIRFRPTGITLSDVGGFIGSSSASVQGTITPEGANLLCKVKVNPGDLTRLNVIPQDVKVLRDIPVSLTLNGPLASLGFSAEADLRANGIRWGSILRKEAGAPLRIEASGIRQASKIQLEELYLVIGGAQISGRASVERGKGASVSLHLPPQGIRSEALIPFFDPSLEVQPGGRIEGDATVRIDEAGSPAIDANLQFSHVSLRLPGFHKRTEGINATIQQRGNAFRLAVGRAKHGSSRFAGTMTVVGWAEPRVDVSLEFSFLDTQDFAAPPGYVSAVTWGEWIRSNPAIRLLARSRGTGFVKVAKGDTSSKHFSDFVAQIDGKDGLLKVTNWHIKIADGILRGSALFDIRKETQTPLTLEIQGDQLRMEKVMMSDPEWLRVEGDVIVDGQLQWKLNANRATDGIYKEGSIEVRVHNGVINRFDILSKLFTLINLGSIVRGHLPDLIAQGLPFQLLTWQMEVFGTKWNFKNMQLTSDAARVNASGIYLSDQDRIDFRVDVSPLVGLDTVFSGLFGHLITRNGKILTTTFRVRGLYKSPDVRLEPFENLNSSK